MAQKRHTHCILGGTEGNHLENQDIDGRKIPEWILNQQDRRTWIGLIWIRTGTS